MLKKFIFGNFFTIQVLIGQNLILNPRMEFDGQCSLNYNLGSFVATSIDSCKVTIPGDPLVYGSYNVPYPKHSSGIVGVKPKFDGTNTTIIQRAFFCPQFSTSLDSGLTYVVEFLYRPWYRNTHHPIHIGTLISDNLGSIRVGGTFIWSNSHTPDTELNQPLTDTANWTRYLQSFVADGDTSRRLVIGGFHPDTEPQIPNQVAQSSN
ncbi:MAG: hypothetical protein RJA97_1155, partial [Bacteroidota bacterium]